MLGCARCLINYTTMTKKRRAEDCADSVSGVKHTQNNLRIREMPRETENP